MIFTEYRFPLFFAVVFLLHWSLQGHRSRKLLLLLASYSFYAFWDWRFLSLIFVSTLVDFLSGARIAASEKQATRKRWLMLSLVLNLGLLAVFKYCGFFVDSAAALLELLGFQASLPALAIGLPVGISFYTFQTMSYSLDIYSRKIEPTRDLLDMALFVGFFPQLVAGPIVRAREFLPQLARKTDWNAIKWQPMLWLLLVGYMKKACLADSMSVLVDAYFLDPAGHSAGSAVLALLAFSFQIYGDFSGYSDMAIGLAGLLGYALPLNFDYPLMASNISDFWRRWHMTLTRWVHDYVFKPLGGASRSTYKRFRNLIITMGLLGLWHGAAWNFVLWGLMQAALMIVYRVWHRKRVTAGLHPGSRFVLGVCLTYASSLLGGLLFRCADMQQAMTILGLIVGASDGGAASFGWPPWALLAVVWTVYVLFYRYRPEKIMAAMPSWAFAALLGFLAPLALAFSRTDMKPFIYFQF